MSPGARWRGLVPWSVFSLAVVGCAASGRLGATLDEGDGGGVGADAAAAPDAPSEAAPPDAAPADARLSDAGPSDASDAARCDGPTGLLDCAFACTADLFEPGFERHDFGAETALPGSWRSGPHLPPRVDSDAGAEAFGPHPMTASWWENYTSALSNGAGGDGLLCAELRVFAEASGDLDDNAFELVVRLPVDGGYESSGMTAVLRPNSNTVGLHTRLSDTQWAKHDTQALLFERSTPTDVRVLLYAKGDRYAAIVGTKTAAAALRARYTLPVGGGLAMIGWRSPHGVMVKRHAFGTPEKGIAAALDKLLP